MIPCWPTGLQRREIQRSQRLDAMCMLFSKTHGLTLHTHVQTCRTLSLWHTMVSLVSQPTLGQSPESILYYIYILLLMGMLEYAGMLTQTFGFEWHQLMRCFDIGHPVLTMNAQASWAGHGRHKQSSVYQRVGMQLHGHRKGCRLNSEELSWGVRRTFYDIPRAHRHRYSRYSIYQYI